MNLKLDRNNNLELKYELQSTDSCSQHYPSENKGLSVGLNVSSQGISHLICNEITSSRKDEWEIPSYDNENPVPNDDSLSTCDHEYESGKWACCPLGIENDQSVWIVDSIYRQERDQVYGVNNVELNELEHGVKCIKISYLNGSLCQKIFS